MTNHAAQQLEAYYNVTYTRETRNAIITALEALAERRPLEELRELADEALKLIDAEEGA